MKLSISHNAILYGVVLAVASMEVFVSCTDKGNTLPADEAVGSIGIHLTLPGGEAIDTITYTIQGPNAYAGTEDVTGPTSTFSFVIQSVAPGSGYTITLTATSNGGAVACNGTSAPFSVDANQTTGVSVLLACSTTGDAGSVLINGTGFNCATWQTATANPTTTTTGGTIALVASATGPDPAAVTYQWSAPTGTLDNATTANATFTCPPTPGDVTITLAVGDGPVPDGGACPAASSTTTLNVTCAAPDDAGAPACDGGGAVPPACDGTVSLVSGPPFTGLPAVYRPVVGDLNGDGLPDVVMSGQGVAEVFVSAGDAQFTQATLSAGSGDSLPLLGDMNGDGKLDYLQFSYVTNDVAIFPGVGDGTFGPPITFATGDANPIGGALADFDGDGKLDMAVSHNNGGWTTRVLLNQGGWSFALKWSLFLGANPHSLAAADFDADGKTDLAVSTVFNGLQILLNNGDGTFYATQSPGAAGGYTGEIVTADLNGDGQPDLAGSDGSKINVLLNNGTPFSTRTTYAVTSGISESFVVLDLDGKLGPDLVAASSPSSLSVRFNKGDGTFGAETLLPAGISAGYVTTGDFNCDGRPDVVAALFPDGNFAAGTLSILLDTCSP